MTTKGSSTPSFAARSREVVEKFLQSVVVLDDQASMGTEQDQPLDHISAITSTPNFPTGSSANLNDGSALTGVSAPKSETGDSNDTDSIQEGYRELGLYSKPLIDGFANLN